MFKNIKLFKKIIYQKKQKAILISASLYLFGFSLIFIPSGIEAIAREPYETRIQLDTNSANLLFVPEKKVEIYTAGSRADLNSLNQEAIKQMMKFYGQKYNMDWKLVYAIGYHESANYTSSLARNQYNFFGRKASSGGYASWSTPEEGIKNQFEYLQSRYFDRGLTTPASINKVYAEDMSWHYKIESVMANL